MLYDNSNPLQKANFLARANLLAERGEVVELRSKRQRSLNQNAYLHVIIGYFAVMYGEASDYIKEEYFKKLVNPDTFIVARKLDKFTNRERIVCRSTSDLTVEEMSALTVSATGRQRRPAYISLLPKKEYCSGNVRLR